MRDNPSNEFVSREIADQAVLFVHSAMAQLQDQTGLKGETIRYLNMTVHELSKRILDRSMTYDQAWQTFYNMLA